MAPDNGTNKGTLLASLLAPVILLLLVAIGGWLVVTLGGAGRLLWLLAAIALLIAVIAVVYLITAFLRFGREDSPGDRSAAELGRTAKTPAPLFVDTLTELPTEYWFNQTLASELARSRRYHRHLSLVILDLDHFSRVNRVHGQSTSDRLLAEIAHILKSSVRQSDHLARVADDEFAILVCETNEAGALNVAEKLRAAIEHHEFGKSVQVTVSAGVATIEDSDTVETFLRRGEAAAMTARRSGGNSVATATF